VIFPRALHDALPIFFLHEVGRGAADRSYGIQVAKLAGLPAAVVERARDVLARLEQGAGSPRATSIVDDRPLFSTALRQPAPRPRSEEHTSELQSRAN